MRYLLLTTPRPHQIIEALHDRSPEALGAVFRCHESDLLTPWRQLRLGEQGVPPQLRSSARLCVQSLHRTASSAAATLSWGRSTGVAMAAFCQAGATELP